MKKILVLLLALMMALSLVACGGDGSSSDNGDEIQSSQREQNGSETAQDENDGQTDPPDETDEPDGGQQSGQSTEEEYIPGAWITDNVRVTFYKNYKPEEDNTKLVLSVYGDRALFQAIKSDGSISAETLYIQTDAGVTTESFLIPGVESTYLTMDAEGQTLKSFLPGIMDIVATFEWRVMNPKLLKDYTADGSDTQAGRKCDRYTAGASILRHILLVDQEFGIVMRRDTIAQKDGKEETVNFSLVEALEYGVVAVADVPESLTDGSTPAEANEIDQSQVYEAWASLVGYWHAADGRFFLLDMADSHSAWFEEGIWDTSYGRGGYVTDLSLTSNTIHQGTVHYDAVEATEMDEARPAEEVALRVDWADLDNDGKIRITLGDETYYCAFAGQTAEEAYAVHQRNMADIAAAQ